MGRIVGDQGGAVYLPTQAIADFLANALDPPVDGIFYPSVQVGFAANSGALLASRRIGRNVVLFHKGDRLLLFGQPGCQGIVF